MSTLPTPAQEPEISDNEPESLINDPGNEDPGSIEEDARVPLIEEEPPRP